MDLVSNNAAAVDAVCVQDVGHAVVCNVSAEQFHTGGDFPFTVDIRNAREEKHAVVHISLYVFVDVGPYSEPLIEAIGIGSVSSPLSFLFSVSNFHVVRPLYAPSFEA